MTRKISSSSKTRKNTLRRRGSRGTFSSCKRKFIKAKVVKMRCNCRLATSDRIIEQKSLTNPEHRSIPCKVMRGTRLLLLLLILAAGAERAYSQTCPQFSVACPSSIDTSPVTFAVRFAVDNPPVGLTFKWTVSVGKIVGGQGTSSITVDTTGIEEKSITATVEVGGLPEGCGNIASCSTPLEGGPPKAREFDEYGNLSWAEERARLDKFADHLEPGITLRSHRKKLSRKPSNPGNRIVR